MFRSLSNAAQRTFHKAPPLNSQPSPTAIDDPITLHSDPNCHAHALADPAGPEASFVFTPTASLPVDAGASSSAGWHLIPDEKGSGHPLHVRKPNQDSFAVSAPALADGLYVAVFDGHGTNGREASQLVRDLVPQTLSEVLCLAAHRTPRTSRIDRRRHFVRAFVRAFCDAERALRDPANEVDHAFSGTTATCCWLDGSDLFCAWAGDSRAVLARRVSLEPRPVQGSPHTTVAVDLSSDHKPVRRDEKRRVRNAGGRVTRWHSGLGPQRVWLPDEWVPGLAMTRSVGDTILTKYGVTPSPEVTVTRLGGDEEFLVVASDGVWEFMSSTDVVDLIRRERDAGVKAMDAAKTLVDEAVRRWKIREQVVDDTTAVVVYLNMPEERKECLFKEECEEEGLRRSLAFLRKPRLGARLDVRVGEPLLVSSNGKLESFSHINSEDCYESVTNSTVVDAVRCQSQFDKIDIVDDDESVKDET